MLQSVQFVIDPDGRPSAVQIDIEAWESLLDWLEDLEDRAVVKEALPRLHQRPEKAGALSWEAIKAQWDLLGREPGCDAV